MKEELHKQVEVLFEKLRDFLTSKTLVGEEIKIGEVTIVPIVEVTFGMGVGTRSGGDKDTKDQEKYGGGMGLGVKARPSAFIVIKEEKVELISLRKSGSLEVILEKFPSIMDKFISKSKDKKEEKKEEEKEKK
ncbi:MAG TPA: sporulation protein [Candidatus Atribacteria bacterium]|nr:sporulation protein [Candidatus Atribacteria bacterium]